MEPIGTVCNATQGTSDFCTPSLWLKPFKRKEPALLVFYWNKFKDIKD